MKKITFCILGATSHIAKGLIWSLNNTGNSVYLFARDTKAVESFIKQNCFCKDQFIICSLDHFKNNKYDIIINCIGIADPIKQKKAGSDIFFLTEHYDNQIINYLKDKPATLYINFSSGAVYGTSFIQPVTESSTSLITVNSITPLDYYRIAKLNSEAKHRSLQRYNIVDIRIFSYFSRFIDLTSSFLMTDIVESIVNKTIMTTNNTNIIRDYLHPEDLFRMIMLCADKKNINDVFDIYSAKPISKFELIALCENRYELKYSIEHDVITPSSTGVKNIYSSENNHAKMLGYTPQYTSAECIKTEIDAILKK